MGFSRQEYWSGLPRPPPRGLSNSGTKHMSPEMAGRFFTIEPPGKPHLEGVEGIKMQSLYRILWALEAERAIFKSLQINITMGCQEAEVSQESY